MDGEQNNANINPNTGGGSSGGTGSAGPIIAVIVILAIIILGGLYFWGQRTDNMMNYGSDTTSPEVEGAYTDDASSIEADLNSTDVENIDAELNAS